MKILLVHPGASWSTADVEIGLRAGLSALPGVSLIRYRLDDRIVRAGSWLHRTWRQLKKHNPDIPKPTVADTVYHAGIGALEMALRHQVDVVFVVSAMFMHPDVIVMMKRAGLRVVVLFTETPYDLEKELVIARLVDGCWTNERTAVDTFLAVNAASGYLQHAQNPDRHQETVQPGDEEVPAHDVVFVGTGFADRVAWLNGMDWRGLDFGLYGSWKGVGLRPHVKACVRGETTDNVMTARLYRRAKIGINLHRSLSGWGPQAPKLVYRAESLNPRAYELAACGVFFVQDHRAESADVFGDLVPTVQTPQEASQVLRQWLADDAGRLSRAAQLPACVAEHSWRNRAATVYADLVSLVQGTRAA